MGCLVTKDEIKNMKYDEEEYSYERSKVFIPPIKYCRVCRVYDGDTFTILVKLPWENKEIYRYSVRVKGIDCPELRTKDKEEKELGIIARDYVRDKINENNSIVELKEIEYDKYGRLCADVYIGKECLKEMLIEKRLGVEYDGGKKNSPLSWKEYYINR